MFDVSRVPDPVLLTPGGLKPTTSEGNLLGGRSTASFLSRLLMFVQIFFGLFYALGLTDLRFGCDFGDIIPTRRKASKPLNPQLSSPTINNNRGDYKVCSRIWYTVILEFNSSILPTKS